MLDVLVQPRRNTKAAKKFFRKLLKGLRYVPRVIITDKLASYQVAHREMLASVEHRRSKYLNLPAVPCSIFRFWPTFRDGTWSARVIQRRPEAHRR